MQLAFWALCNAACIAFTNTSPSFTPLLRTASSTCGVMFTNPTRDGMLNVSVSRCDFIRVISARGHLATFTFAR